MDSQLKTLSIKKLFEEGQYVIPIYQRNYAWEEREINQLIQDVADYAKEKGKTNYYIGTLVVYERKAADGKVVFETIDGQQRLTTLNILLSTIKRLYGFQLNGSLRFSLNIAYDSRPQATETLQAIASNAEEIPYPEEYASSIRQAFDIAEKGLKKILQESRLSIQQFYEYLRNQVFILRVSVPKDTNLNHYFEIMNNRGEQLEKHEILKAKMLKALSHAPDLSYAFDLIWEASADMERYLQYGFSVAQRDRLFGQKDWNQLQAGSLREAAALLGPMQKQEKAVVEKDEEELPIVEIISTKLDFYGETKSNEEPPERFTSVINFPNFLLHVLRIQTKKDIPLDDKRLLETFDDFLKVEGEQATAFVERFGFSLLKSKFLFDKYILKREFTKDKDQWSLQRLKRYDGSNVNYVNTFGEDDTAEKETKEVLMALAMFHVSTPTQVYKHWLNAALKYVFEYESITANSYLQYLEGLARAFLFNRYLAEEPEDYFRMIYTEVGNPRAVNLVWARLNKGTDVENFIFNYLDFLLWKSKSPDYQNFEFAFRSSVEHYYPRKPLSTLPKLAKGLDDFGNLRLISSSKNSRLSNNTPKQRKIIIFK